MTVDAGVSAEKSVNFMADVAYRYRRFTTLNMVDDGIRGARDIEIDTSAPGDRVART